MGSLCSGKALSGEEFLFLVVFFVEFFGVKNFRAVIDTIFYEWMLCGIKFFNFCGILNFFQHFYKTLILEHIPCKKSRIHLRIQSKFSPHFWPTTRHFPTNKLYNYHGKLPNHTQNVPKKKTYLALNYKLKKFVCP